MNLLNQANIEFNNGKFEASKVILLEILSREHRNIEALQLLGIIYANEQNLIKSIEIFTKAIKFNPINPQLLFNRGNALNDSGKHEEAIVDFEKSLLLDSKNVKTLVAYGNALKHCGYIKKALDSYDSALKINPQFYEAILNKASLLQGLSDYDNAILLLERAITLAPQLPYAFFNLGVLFQNLRRLDEALLNYNKAIFLMPGYVDAHINRGNILRELGQFEEAVLCFEYLLTIIPNNIYVFNNLGIVFDELKNYEKAILNYDIAISIDPTFANAFMNKGNTLRKLRQLDDAIVCFQYALNIDKNNYDAYINIGNCLKEQKKLDESIEIYDKVISINPNFAEAYFNKSLSYLLKGDFSEGWKFYEWRWKQVKPFSPLKHIENKKFWNGSKLNGTLLVLPEQGVGDEILYLGMISEVKERVNRLVVAVDSRLVPICIRSFEGVFFVSVDTVDKNFECDAQIYMGSLGRYFRNDANCFHNVRLGYLKANLNMADELRSKMIIHNKKICGVSWASSNREFGENKSITLCDMLPLFVNKDFHYVNLQYGDTSSERQTLFESTGLYIDEFQNIDKFNDLEGLASLISACDIVVTVSNTTAHLAAALGKPVLILLAEGYGLLHYWQVERHDSPWYPSVKLYRQKVIGSFDELMQDISNDIKNYQSL